jgi:steroid 5-alpha reductase family enzyme
MLQMVLMLIVAIPILVVNLEYIRTPEWFFIGWEMDITRLWFVLILWVLIALSGLLFETIADLELKAFLKIKKPWEIFTSWLYRYSRHPNYFGESMFWLGISLLSLPFSALGLVGWIVITSLLLFVSGVPLQEARYAGRPNWEEYKRKTSVFIPWFPKK